MNNTLLKGLSVIELLSRSERPLNLTQIGQERCGPNQTARGLLAAITPYNSRTTSIPSLKARHKF